MAFMPALALHSAMARPSRKPNVSFPSLFAAIREISVVSKSSVSAGTTPAATDKCLLIMTGSANSA